MLLAYQLDNLRVFLSVAAEQSIAEAAKKLFMSPSAVSRCTHELEKALGIRLFERNARGVLLNNYGRTVLVRALRIKEELRQPVPALTVSRMNAGPLSPSAIRSVFFSGRKLLLLVRLASTKKLSSAAEQMNMTQSGASMALARMESDLGVQLFRRGKQGLVLTDVVGPLVVMAKRVFAEFRHMISDISATSGLLQGWVSIGTSPLARTLVVPAAVTAVLANNPKIRVAMMESTFDARLLALRSGDIDAMIGMPRDESDTEGLMVEPLFTDQLTIIARTDHPLTRRSRLTPADLVQERWILPAANSQSRLLFEAWQRRKRLEVPATVESADLALIRYLLLTSDMLAVTSTCQFLFELRSGTLTTLRIPLTGMKRDVGLLSRKGALLSPAALAVLEALRAEGKTMQQGLEAHGYRPGKG